MNIRRISAEQLAQLGMQQIAYVRPALVDGTPGFAIHAADGTLMAVADERSVAIEAILQHDMLPGQVH